MVRTKSEAYGKEITLDLYGCKPSVIRSRRKLQEYVDRLVALINMKKYGRTLIPHFGHDDPKTDGFSLVQLIETSSITGHFSELWNSAYINIFSCAPYDHARALAFTKKFFGAKRVVARVHIRK
ncbi:MAG: hypothetical protein A3A44_02255 [Candidatus Sungbacteria bacterium RIFCSPLOWO2_01_FULL_60_25]|uniref:S-adenosylmethionine decarboxylase n=1 Tax=Candidatus Sungbacteria bacterium RIFCSPLOWO2_01_FULL_60_25 TaxID=1802281 RepID=A0A1G2LDK9_9BACT|nr:MAG: hypothetical protein A3A44_02255 [Candidatus Sungbacteria bacterium RIFCSPLOWO2_01_FULL_60_25]